MLLAIKLAKLGDVSLEADISTLEGRMRGARLPEAAWAEVYRAALALVPRARGAQAEAERRSVVEVAEQDERKRVQAASLAIPTALQRVASDYQGRIGAQEAELAEKSQRSVAKLLVTSRDDAATGETTFTYVATELGAFLKWLSDAEEKWREHNETLVADRANEAIAIHLSELTSLRFAVAAPKLARRAPQPLTLKGHAVPTPGGFERLARTWRTAASVTGSLTILSMLVARAIPGVDTGASAAIIGGVFVVTLLVAGFVTVPKERRQQRNRLLAKAEESVAKELQDAVKARLRGSGEAQLRAIRAHLASEGDRWKAQTSRMSTGEMRIPVLQAGLSPENRAKLEVSWPHAIGERLAELTPPQTKTQLTPPQSPPPVQTKTQLMK